MFILIIYLPLIAWIITSLTGRFMSTSGVKYFMPSIIFIISLLSWYCFYRVGLTNEPIQYTINSWIHADTFNVDFGFLFDTLTVSMLILVTTVSFCVHWYACDYMGNDPHLPRFLSYLTLFTLFMIILVTGDNILQLFIGWEGVGICSYLLINFWFTRIQANKAAIKAMILNRIGDMGLILAMFFIYDMFDTLQFYVIFDLINAGFEKHYTFMHYSIDGYEIISLLLLFGAVGKSAQIGLHTWLPDAMEGPTPVSALIHAATMVTAGVFLLIRCSTILDHAPIALTVITIVGGLTAFLAATIGIFQYDIKKVIAYSTCSQLGYMVFTCGLSSYSLSLFHLVNHGFFKALLFLSAGNIIHALADEQDMRKLGGLIRFLPFTFSITLIGSLSLMGFPYLTGYYSKDSILELAQAPLTSSTFWIFFLGVYSAFFTAFYSLRLIYYTFIIDTNCQLKHYSSVHEVSKHVTPCLTLLAIASLFFGYALKDAFIGLGTDFFGPSIPTFVNTYFTIEADFLTFQDKFLPVFLSCIAATLAVIVGWKYIRLTSNLQMTSTGSNFFTFFNNKWHFDFLYNTFITKPVLTASHELTFKALDKGLFEVWGPTGLVKHLNKLSSLFSALQSGNLYHYALVIILFTFCAINLINAQAPSLILIVVLICFYLQFKLNKN